MDGLLNVLLCALILLAFLALGFYCGLRACCAVADQLKKTANHEEAKDGERLG